MHIYFLIGVFTALNGADVYLTKRILDLGGFEKNKAANFLIKELGYMKAALFVKGAIFAGFAWGFSVNPDYIFIPLLAGSAFYAWVVMHNAKVLKGMRK